MSSGLSSSRESLTAKQSAVLTVIATEISEQRRPPTVREIAAILGVASTNAVRDHLATLERKGYIRISRHCARGITLLNTPGETLVRPFVGLDRGAESVCGLDLRQESREQACSSSTNAVNSHDGVDVAGEVLVAYNGNTGWNKMPDMFVERDDFCIVRSEGARHHYFCDFSDWPQTNREAIQFVQGKVLDVGCAAGRIGLYLQRQGFDIVNIDKSPGAVKVAKQRGLRNVELLPLEAVGALSPAQFDTVTLMCNCFGLVQDFAMARIILNTLAAITSGTALIIAESNDPYRVTDPEHMKYRRRNVRLNRMPGQSRIRLRYKNLIGGWFDDLSVSREEMIDILEGSQWQVRRFIDDAVDPQYYVALIGKRKR
jgi:SAM-dependent methyltransferase